MGFNKVAGDQLPAAELNSFYASAGLYGISSTGNDSYAITVTPAPNDYDAGDTYTFKADVANTGAATLNVNSLGAKTIKKFGTLDLDTGDIAAEQVVTVKYDGTNFQLVSAGKATSFFQQAISAPTQVAAQGTASGSSSDGSVIYAIHKSTNQDLRRYARDPVTGAYLQTHAAQLTVPFPSGFRGSIVELGIYIYLFHSDGTNIKVFRFLASNLTGQATMTVPTVAATSVTAWTDGTDIHLVTGTLTTTSRKWSVLGTTFTAVSTSTVTANAFASATATHYFATMFDGTNVYVVKFAMGAQLIDVTIQKVTTLDGTVFTSTSKTFNAFSDADINAFIVNIDATKIYIGPCYAHYDETAMINSFINLTPVSKP